MSTTEKAPSTVTTSDTAFDIVAIPLGTRLTGLAVGNNGEVHVWIGNKDKSLPYEQWEGTFLRIEPSGRITRVTKDTSNTPDYDELEIRNGVRQATVQQSEVDGGREGAVDQTLT